MDAKELPAHPSLEQYKKQAKELVKLYNSADPEAIQRIRQFHPRFRALADQETQSGPFLLADAHFTIAREHGFESWPKFARHIEAMSRESSPVSQFELAVDAIVSGDEAALRRLLHENRELVRARSTREHQATLLHYTSANGVEDYRQKTPRNAVEIAKILLEAGAEVDAVSHAYGSDTTLGLVATSFHPERAGVQIPLLQLLLDHGASIDGAPGGWSPLIAALHNGRGEAAEFLAQRGAHLDIEGAAGAGRLDVVRSFFAEDGSLRADATKTKMELGFLWACEYGRNAVVEFLLDRGVDLAAQADTGLTGLHWAVVGGQLDTIRLLIERGAPLELRNIYGGTVLGQALWASANGDAGIDYVPVIEALIQAGAVIEHGSLNWLARQQGSSTTRIEEVLRRHGASS